MVVVRCQTGSADAMSQRRKSFSYLRLFLQIQLRQNYALAVRRTSQNFSPGIDDQTVAISLSAAWMVPALRRGKHIAEVFDSPGADEDFPMSPPGLRGKRCGNREPVCAAGL